MDLEHIIAFDVEVLSVEYLSDETLNRKYF